MAENKPTVKETLDDAVKGDRPSTPGPGNPDVGPRPGQTDREGHGPGAPDVGSRPGQTERR